MQTVTAQKKILSGNEAIAQAAWTAGVRVAAAYPGTPSTEILENLSKFPDVYCEWSVNEKVAMEVGVGSSLAGARTLVTMKHVGLNVALDPLMTFAYIGATGGMVIICSDDPGMHSSQNEQDNRTLAKFARVPLLEPASSQECYDMVRLGFDISEEFSIPVIVRTTTRTSHASGIVDVSGHPCPETTSDHVSGQGCPDTSSPRASVLHRIERGDGVGIITSGISYQHAREAFPEASILKLGMTFPLPKKLITDFAASVDKVYVIEEGDEYLEEQILAMGVEVEKPSTNLRIGELTPDRMERLAAEVYGQPPLKPAEAIGNLPARPPVLCPGCSHRGVFYALNRLKAVVPGDIGCYSLGAFQPLFAMDTIVCMGASVGTAHGMQKAGQQGPVAAVIGDSTFFHSGITGLLNIVYNRGGSTIIVLDNRTTAMTGHQDHPGTGRTIMGVETVQTQVEDVARGVGVTRVRVVDPYDLENTYNVIKEEIESDEPSVVVSKRPCVLWERGRKFTQYTIDQDACKACGLCLRLGCPAIEVGDPDPEKPKMRKARINPVLCAGCGMCVQVCKFGAIKQGT